METDSTGVVFKEEDYAGFWRRLIILIVDLFVVIVITTPCYLADSYRYEEYYSDNELVFFYVGMFLSYLYLTVLKASKIGSIGQIVTGTEILTIRGRRPNIFLMTYRLLFWLVGPVNFIADLAFIYMNKEKRTLRDGLCNTIVLKRSADPISNTAEIRNIRVMVFGFYILYQSPARS